MRLVPTPLYAAALGVSLTALEARQTTAAAGWQWRPWLPGDSRVLHGKVGDATHGDNNLSAAQADAVLAARASRRAHAVPRWHPRISWPFPQVDLFHSYRDDRHAKAGPKQNPAPPSRPRSRRLKTTLQNRRRQDRAPRRRQGAKTSLLSRAPGRSGVGTLSSQSFGVALRCTALRAIGEGACVRDAPQVEDGRSAPLGQLLTGTAVGW
ncbi:hypothetical protein ACCO45_011089 [Purpureocillium lilacinum]|uniref:Uncharacterized protein n=1 Tax=Purpureocillium lilacinum TaxID=33203 RepID=A0ACC4DJA8_PURLI